MPITLPRVRSGASSKMCQNMPALRNQQHKIYLLVTFGKCPDSEVRKRLVREVHASATMIILDEVYPLAFISHSCGCGRGKRIIFFHATARCCAN